MISAKYRLVGSKADLHQRRRARRRRRRCWRFPRVPIHERRLPWVPRLFPIARLPQPTLILSPALPAAVAWLGPGGRDVDACSTVYDAYLVHAQLRDNRLGLSRYIVDFCLLLTDLLG